MVLNSVEVTAMQTLTDQGYMLYRQETQRLQKSAGIAYLLWLLFGTLGIHKFYIKKDSGVLYLILAGVVYSANSPDIMLGAGFPLAYIDEYMMLGLAAMVVLGIFLLVDLASLGHQVDTYNREVRQIVLNGLAPTFARHPIAPASYATQPHAPLPAPVSPYNFPPPPNTRR